MYMVYSSGKVCTVQMVAQTHNPQVTMLLGGEIQSENRIGYKYGTIKLADTEAIVRYHWFLAGNYC